MNFVAVEVSSCPQILPTPPPCPITPSTTTTVITEGQTTVEPKSEQPTINEQTTTAEEEPTIITISNDTTSTNENELVTDSDGISTNTDEVMTDDLVDTQDESSQPLLIGTATAVLAVGILISLTVLVSVLICKKRRKTFGVTQTSLQLGVTNRLRGIANSILHHPQSRVGLSLIAMPA